MREGRGVEGEWADGEGAEGRGQGRRFLEGLSAFFYSILGVFRFQC